MAIEARAGDGRRYDHPSALQIFPETGEEKYRSFLGIPIIERGSPIGVLVDADSSPAAPPASRSAPARHRGTGGHHRTGAAPRGPEEQGEAAPRIPTPDGHGDQAPAGVRADAGQGRVATRPWSGTSQRAARRARLRSRTGTPPAAPGQLRVDRAGRFHDLAHRLFHVREAGLADARERGGLLGDRRASFRRSLTRTA